MTSGSLSKDCRYDVEIVSRFEPAAMADEQSSRTAVAVGVSLTIGIVAIFLAYADRSVLPSLAAMIPHQPLFWIALAVFYWLTPCCDWLIYRRLWRIPPSGILALAQKFSANEVVLGYSGDVHFYRWARRHIGDRCAPFGAIKDVAILSALTGNAITLALLVATVFLPGERVIGFDPQVTSLSLGVVITSSTVMLALRNRMFTLPRSHLAFVVVVQSVRVVAGLILTMLLWHLVMPWEPLLTWLLLAALRMLIFRLPLVANKDLVLATLALLTLGNVPQLAPMLLMMAVLLMPAHLVIGAVGALSLSRRAAQ